MELNNSKIKIKSKNLNVYYGNKQALHNINLEINNKEVTALIGPSGCGKSTFIRCINRMNDTIDICKVDGSIEIDGKEVNDKNVDVVTLREKIGMVCILAGVLFLMLLSLPEIRDIETVDECIDIEVGRDRDYCENLYNENQMVNLISFIIAGSLVVGGLGLYLTSKDEASEKG